MGSAISSEAVEESEFTEMSDIEVIVVRIVCWAIYVFCF